MTGKKISLVALSCIFIIAVYLFQYFLSITKTDASEDDFPHITIMTGKVNTENFDGDMISAALDEYLFPILHAHVDIDYIEFEHSDQILAQYTESRNKPDLFMSWSSHYIEKMAIHGDLYPLDDFLNGDGKEVADLFEDSVYRTIHTYNGHIYALPTLTDRSQAICVEYRSDIAKQYNLPMEQVKTLDDLTEIYRILHNQTDEIVPVSGVEWVDYDPLTDSLGILGNYGQSDTIVNLYECKEYRDLCFLIKEWQKSGFLKPANSTSAINYFTRSPWLFSRVREGSPNLACMDSADAGENIQCIFLTENYVFTDILKHLAWAVSASTEHPDIVLAFLKLMYTDRNVMNLLSYGIEGIHYRIIDEVNDVIGFPKGVDTYNSGYAQFKSYYYGNEFISSLWEGYPLDLWDQIKETNRKSIRSKAYGFVYDPQPVIEKVQRCLYIVETYDSMLMAGIGDTDSLLLEFNNKLKEAGIDDIIKEKQRQFNEWLMKNE